MNDQITATRGDGDDGKGPQGTSHYLWHLSAPWRGVTIIDVGHSRKTKKAEIWFRGKCQKRITADSDAEALEMLGIQPVSTPLPLPDLADVESSYKFLMELHKHFENELRAARRENDYKRADQCADQWQKLQAVRQRTADLLRSMRG